MLHKIGSVSILRKSMVERKMRIFGHIVQKTSLKKEWHSGRWKAKGQNCEDLVPGFKRLDQAGHGDWSGKMAWTNQSHSSADITWTWQWSGSRAADIETVSNNGKSHGWGNIVILNAVSCQAKRVHTNQCTYLSMEPNHRDFSLGARQNAERNVSKRAVFCTTP